MLAEIAPAPLAVPTADDVLDWFEHLDPRDQYNHLLRACRWLDVLAATGWADEAKLERTRHALDLVHRVLFQASLGSTRPKDWR